MAVPSSSRGYGPSNHWQRLYFDGDERRFEQWLIKFLGYMRLRKLKDDIDLSVTTTNRTATVEADAIEAASTAPTSPTDDAEENAVAFAELIQFLDDRSLSLVMRDAYDGRKALNILKEHYAGKGKPRIISLCTKLTSLSKLSTDSVTDYVIKGETTATALRNGRETVSDELLTAMILKGLPVQYKPFEVVITQNDKNMTFTDFKVALRNTIFFNSSYLVISC